MTALERSELDAMIPQERARHEELLRQRDVIVDLRVCLKGAIQQRDDARKALAELWGSLCPDCGPDDYAQLVALIVAEMSALLKNAGIGTASPDLFVD